MYSLLYCHENTRVTVNFVVKFSGKFSREVKFRGSCMFSDGVDKVLETK